MVSTKHEEILWIFDLICEHKANGFYGLFSSIYIVSEEEIVSLSRKSCVLKELDEIGVLSMNIS
jgi:hypothetical protein